MNENLQKATKWMDDHRKATAVIAGVVIGILIGAFLFG